MKYIVKSIITLILVSIINTSQAQILISLLLGDKLNTGKIEFGLEGGMNISSINQLETNKSMRAFNLGFYFDIKLKNQWELATGCLVKAKHGADELTNADLKDLNADTISGGGNYTLHHGYFMVPILLKYKFHNRIYLEAGTRLSLLNKAWVQYDYEENKNEAKVKQYNRDGISRLDAGAEIGIGYRLAEINSMSFGIRYYYGLVDVFQNKSGSNNQAIFLLVKIPIGATPKKG